jgi:hypothetical protein
MLCSYVPLLCNNWQPHISLFLSTLTFHRCCSHHTAYAPMLSQIIVAHPCFSNSARHPLTLLLLNNKILFSPKMSIKQSCEGCISRYFWPPWNETGVLGTIPFSYQFQKNCIKLMRKIWHCTKLQNCTEWFSIHPYKSSKSRTIVIFKSFVKLIIQTRIVGISMIFSCTIFNLSKCNSSWVIPIKQNMNLNTQMPSTFIFLAFHKTSLTKSSSPSDVLSAYKI